MKARIASIVAGRRLLDEGRRTRSMMWIMAIMMFLTVLAAALGLGAWATARALDRQVTGRLTVQIVDADEGTRTRSAARALAALRLSPAVARATLVDRGELTRLLRPWLGEESEDPDLPIPAMIDVDLSANSPAAIANAMRAVRTAAPDARIDAHERWMSPVSNLVALVTWLAVSIVLLMAAATSAVVILAARAGLDTHRDTIEVLHMLGSTDVQVARLFQRRLAFDTLAGGVIGAGVAAAVLLFIGWQLMTIGSDLLAGATLGWGSWLALAMLPLMFTLLATYAARVAVLGALRRFL